MDNLSFKVTQFLFLITTLVLSFQYAHGNNEAPMHGGTEPNQTTVSIGAVELHINPENMDSIEEGLQILRNRDETLNSRKLVIEKFQGSRRQLDSITLNKLRFELTLMADDQSESPLLSEAAVRGMQSIMLQMKDSGQIQRSDIERDASFLIGLSSDKNRDDQLRSAAIRAVGFLELKEGKAVLRQLLSDPVESARPIIAQNALLASWRLEGQGALEAISDVIEHTQSPEIYGTAVFTLGQINTKDSLVAIVQQMNRFPDSGSTGAILVDMEETILDVLSNSENENLGHAISATKKLWREGQRERYFTYLKDLLSTAPMQFRKASLDRILDATSRLEFESEKRELAAVLPLIEDQPELDKYNKFIRQRLTATLLVPLPQDQSVEVPHE